MALPIGQLLWVSSLGLLVNSDTDHRSSEAEETSSDGLRKNARGHRGEI